MTDTRRFKTGNVTDTRRFKTVNVTDTSRFDNGFVTDMRLDTGNVKDTSKKI